MRYGIEVTGNDRIDIATAEIAVHIRDARAGLRYREQEHYDEAMRLRDAIMAGQMELSAPLPPWRAAVNGTSKRPYFLIRGWGVDSDRVPFSQRYHNGPGGNLARYATLEGAERAAGVLNSASEQVPA